MRGDQVLVSDKDAQLVEEDNGIIGLLDLRYHHIFRLDAHSYYAGMFKLKPWPPETVGIFRNALQEACGFWLSPGAIFVGLFTMHPSIRPALPSTTQWLATPNGLHRRTPDNDWTTVLWHPVSHK